MLSCSCRCLLTMWACSTSLPSGNQVDGLPLACHNTQVTNLFNRYRRARLRIFDGDRTSGSQACTFLRPSASDVNNHPSGCSTRKHKLYESLVTLGRHSVNESYAGVQSPDTTSLDTYTHRRVHTGCVLAHDYCSLPLPIPLPPQYQVARRNKSCVPV